jgi:hypothetical protein
MSEFEDRSDPRTENLAVAVLALFRAGETDPVHLKVQRRQVVRRGDVRSPLESGTSRDQENIKAATIQVERALFRERNL